MVQSRYTSQQICDLINETLNLPSNKQIFPHTIHSWKQQGIFLSLTRKKLKKNQKLYSIRDLGILTKLTLMIRILKVKVKDIKNDK